ncbi:MAG: hypothetical protein JO130_13585 [Solirubrobacterales bacterium]|nr:hypothetical protein [Solirubrobacterales bacterium]
MRRTHLIAIAVAIVVFLLISALLARVFSANSAEQSAITTLVTDEAHGDTGAVIGDITGCRSTPACRQRASENVRALAHPGPVSIIQIQPSTSFSIAGTRGFARVAWSVGGSLPIVQCVRVWRTGNAISGLHVELHQVSRRIGSESACPAHF